MKTLATVFLCAVLALVAGTTVFATTAAAVSTNRIQTNYPVDYTIGINFYPGEKCNAFYYLAPDDKASPFPVAFSGWIVEIAITPVIAGRKRVEGYLDKGGLPDFDNYANKHTFLGLGIDHHRKVAAQRQNEKNQLESGDGALYLVRMPDQNRLGYNANGIWLRADKGTDVKYYIGGIWNVAHATDDGWVKISIPFGVEKCPETDPRGVASYIRKSNIPGRLTDASLLVETAAKDEGADHITGQADAGYDPKGDQSNLQKVADAVNLLSAQVVAVAGQTNTNTTDIAQLKADVTSLKQWAASASSQGTQQTQPTAPCASATPPCQQPTNQSYQIAFVCKWKPVAVVYVKVCEDGRWGEFKVNGGVCDFKNETPGHRTLYWRLDQTAAWQQYEYDVKTGMVGYVAVPVGR